MVDLAHIELIQRKIDGELSPVEEDQLTEYLAENPQARELYETMAKIPEMIRCLSVAQPPAELRSEILAAIANERPQTVARPSFAARIRERLPQRHNFKYAYGLAAGIAVGFIIQTSLSSFVIQPANMDYSHYGGTLAPTPVTEQAGPLNTTVFNAANCQGRCRVFQTETGVLVEIEISSAAETNLRLEYDSPGLQLQEFRQQAGGNSVENSPGVLRITHRGENLYLVHFSTNMESSGPITLAVTSAGKQWRRLIHPLEGGK